LALLLEQEFAHEELALKLGQEFAQEADLSLEEGEVVLALEAEIEKDTLPL